MRVIVFDVEATGTKEPQICQLAYIMYGDGFRVSGARNYYMRVNAMNKYAYRVHGLTVETLAKLSDGRTFADYADEIRRDFYWADIYAAHGVSGDVDYLRREFDRIHVPMPVRRRFCTMRAFTGCCGELADGKPKPPRLSELWEYLSLTENEISTAAHMYFGDGSQAHDARFDAAATFLSIRRAAERNLAAPSGCA